MESWFTLCEAIDRFRSIATWAHSNLIFGSYGYRSVAIFRVHAAETHAVLLTDSCGAVDALKIPSICRKNVVLAPCSCASLHHRALQWSCTQFLSWCPVWWAGSEQFASARFQLRSWRPRGLDVYLSNWKNSALLGKLGSFSLTRELEMQRRKQATLRLGALYAFFPMTSVWVDFWQTFQCATKFWICFSWSVRQKLSEKVRL